MFKNIITNNNFYGQITFYWRKWKIDFLYGVILTDHGKLSMAPLDFNRYYYPDRAYRMKLLLESNGCVSVLSEAHPAEDAKDPSKYTRLG